MAAASALIAQRRHCRRTGRCRQLTTARVRTALQAARRLLLQMPHTGCMRICRIAAAALAIPHVTSFSSYRLSCLICWSSSLLCPRLSKLVMKLVALRVAVTVLTCLCLSAPITATYSTRVSQGLLFLYTFNEGQLNPSVNYTADQTTISPSSSLLPYLYIAPVSANWSTYRQGINLTGLSPSNTTVGIQSSSGVSLLITQLSSAFTVEAWLSPACLTCTGAILGFGSWSPSNGSSTGCLGSGSAAAGERDWMFAQSGGQLLTTLSHHGSPSGCSSVAVTLNSSAAYHHIATTVSVQSSGSSATVSSFYNGALVSSSSLTASSLSLWDAFNYLQVSAARVSPSSPPSTWQGALYLLAMYRTALSAAEVLTNYQSGLPNSAPVLASLSQTVSVQQDAQLALLPVSFSASDFDDDALFIIIQSVPAAGSLFLLDQASNATTLLDAAVRFTFAIPSSNVLAFSPANDSLGSRLRQRRVRRL